MGNNSFRLCITRFLPNGELEAGDGMDNVLRNNNSEFWDEFYQKCTLGTEINISFLRHDYGYLQWESISGK